MKCELGISRRPADPVMTCLFSVVFCGLVVVEVAVEMISKFSPFYVYCICKAPSLVGACKKTWHDSVLQRTQPLCRASFIHQRHFVLTGMGQIDLHANKLNQKQAKANYQDPVEYLFQVISAS